MPDENASIAQLGYGLGLERGVGSPLAYAELGQLFDLQAAEKVAGTVDVTHYKSPGRYREFIPTLIDGGQYVAQFHYLPALSEPLLLIFESLLVEPYQLVAPNGVRVRFNGMMTNHGRAFPIEDKMAVSVTLKVSGPENRLAALP